MELAFYWAAVSAGAVAIFWLRMRYGRKEQLTDAPKLKVLQQQAEALNAALRPAYYLINVPSCNSL